MAILLNLPKSEIVILVEGKFNILNIMTAS